MVPGKIRGPVGPDLLTVIRFGSNPVSTRNTRLAAHVSHHPYKIPQLGGVWFDRIEASGGYGWTGTTDFSSRRAVGWLGFITRRDRVFRDAGLAGPTRPAGSGHGRRCGVGDNGNEVRRGMTSPGSLGCRKPARDRHGVVWLPNGKYNVCEFAMASRKP